MASVNSNISQHSVVNALDNHVERLIVDHRRLADLVKELREQCDNLKEEKREQQSRINQLEHSLAQCDLAAGLVASSADKRRAKAYVNRLMREVDSCIALLSAAPRAELGAESNEEQITTDISE